jgi:hypothetical protein
MSVWREHPPAPPQRLEATTARDAAPAASAEVVHGALGCPSLDELAQQDICAALLSTPGLDARHIEVEMTGDGVLLRGTVARPEDRARALRVATRIAAPRPVREALALPSSSDVDAPPLGSPASAARAETARRLGGDPHVAGR